MIPYSPMSRTELADLEARYGRELNEEEALYLLRQERERSMREELFESGVMPSASPGSPRDTGSRSVVTGAHQEVNECENVAADQIVYADDRWPAWVPLAIFVALFIGEAWLAAHFWPVMREWFR